MNAALLMLTSACMAGADPAPAAAPAAPAVVSTGSACSGGGCGTACDTCDTGCGKPGLFAKLRAKFASKSCGCDAAPACAPEPVCKEKCKPAPIVHCKEKCKAEPACAPAPAETCGGCGSACEKVGLFSRLKSKFGGKHSAASCETCDSGCASAPAAAPVVAPAVVPDAKEAPKKEMPKDLPKGGVTFQPIEPIVTPVVAPKPVIEVNGPNNPF